jgi:hypothetical protein
MQMNKITRPTVAAEFIAPIADSSALCGILRYLDYFVKKVTISLCFCSTPEVQVDSIRKMLAK